MFRGSANWQLAFEWALGRLDLELLPSMASPIGS